MNQETWHSVRESLLEDVEEIHDGAFVALEYGEEMADAVSPYAQIARVGNRYWCEIASNTFLPALAERQLETVH